MIRTLDVPYADTRAAALSFALGLPRLDALAVLPVAPPDDRRPRVELRLLGASHQVFVGTFSETVACLPGDSEPVPASHRTSADGWEYEFASETVAHGGDAAFRRAVEDLRDLLSGRDDALTGTFPGSPYAVTALAVDPVPDLPDPVPDLPAAGPHAHAAPTGWRTWHAYPQTREIVMTRSRLVSIR
jgi:hypothetical protein